MVAINFEALTVLPWDETLVSWAVETNDKGGDEVEYLFPQNVIVRTKTYEVENSCEIECDNDCRRCACNDGYIEEFVEVYNIHYNECITYTRVCMDQLGSCWSNYYFHSKEIVEISFKTNWAKFHLVKRNGRIFESHIGYSLGCIWTEEEEIFPSEGETLEDIKRDFIDFYGKYGE